MLQKCELVKRKKFFEQPKKVLTSPAIYGIIKYTQMKEITDYD